MANHRSRRIDVDLMFGAKIAYLFHLKEYCIMYKMKYFVSSQQSCVYIIKAKTNQLLLAQSHKCYCTGSSNCSQVSMSRWYRIGNGPQCSG